MGRFEGLRDTTSGGGTVTSMVSLLTTEDAHRRTSGWKTPHSDQRRADGTGSAPVITTLPLEVRWLLGAPVGLPLCVVYVLLGFDAVNLHC